MEGICGKSKLYKDVEIANLIIHSGENRMLRQKQSNRSQIKLGINDMISLLSMCLSL